MVQTRGKTNKQNSTPSNVGMPTRSYRGMQTPSEVMEPWYVGLVGIAQGPSDTDTPWRCIYLQCPQSTQWTWTCPLGPWWLCDMLLVATVS